MSSEKDIFHSKVLFQSEETLEERLKKAAHVKPGKAIMEWQKKEIIAFIHYGPNTFNGRQWGNGKETPEDYQPTDMDVRQWAKVCAEAGMKHVIPTIKHHDGFCLWHTDSTDFSVKQSPEKTDVAGELAEGCRENGIGLGMYLSPWDMHQREAGLWNTPGYNDYFMKQLEELLTNYGKIEELWFDGACGDYMIWKQVPCYQPEQWYELIHKYQPDAVYRMYDPYFYASEEEWEAVKKGKGDIRWSGKAVRWVGNEEGRTRPDEWSVQPVFCREIAESATYPDLGQESYYEQAVGAVWYPVEVNTTIMNQWFWDPATSRVKSLERLIDTYYQSVGNNGVLLLNLSPDRSGQIPEDQICRLKEFTTFIQNTFAQNLAAGCFPEEWSGCADWKIGESSASIEIELKESCEFDQVMVQEKIEEGQRVAQWSFEVLTEHGWEEVVRKGTIGYKCIRRFPKVVTNRVRLNILKSYDTPILSGFGLFLSQIPEETELQKEEMIRGILPLSEKPEQAELTYKLYRGGVQSAAGMDEASSIELAEEGVCGGCSLKEVPYEMDYSIAYAGVLRVHKSGRYTIELENTDGAVLWIGEKLCINNDEPHELRTESCRIELQEGYYPFRLNYTSFRHSGQLRMNLDVESASGKLITIEGERHGF